MNSVEKVKGSCNCGGVEFEVASALFDVFVCHCSICRKSTASGGIAVAIVRSQDFLLKKGSELITSWQKPNHDWQSNFCKVCGSSVPGKNDESATYIPVGLLNSGHEELKVKHHLFVGSKGTWEKISDDGIQHDNNYDEKNT